MRVLFVYPAHENLGIEYLSAGLKAAGHTTELAFDPVLFDDAFIQQGLLGRVLSHRDALIDQARRFGPDLIAFGVLSPFLQWALDLGRGMKEATGAPVLFGGPHASAAADQLMEHDVVDYVLVGEADGPIVRLVEELGGGLHLDDVPNLVHRRQGTVVHNPLGPFADVATLPWPDKELFLEQSDIFRFGYTALTSRGCAMRCSFCSESFLAGLSDKGERSFLRRRLVDDVIAELVAAKERWGFDHVRFYDTILPVDKPWFHEFAEAYADQVGLPYWCLGHPSLIDVETVKLLERSGCFELQMGIQSIYADTRSEVFHRHETTAHLTRAMDALRDSPIQFAVDNILGVPGQTAEELLDTIDFYVANPPDRLNVYWLTYFPGTTILDIAVQTGDLTEADVGALHRDPRMKAFHINKPAHRRDQHKLFTYLQFALLLPDGWHDVIREHRLYRFLPPVDITMLQALAYRLSSVREYAHLETRVSRRYRSYGKRWLKDRVAGRGTRASLRPARGTSGRS
ncbi:MAG: radical SAM protein [Proteobacteria bacterium]|nr:radical SAM protein [Pseudomonadota bacterium]